MTSFSTTRSVVLRLLLALAALLAIATAAPASDGLAIGEVRAALLGDDPALAVEITSDRPLSAPTIRALDGQPVESGKPVVTLDSGARSALILVPVEAVEPFAGRPFPITLADDGRETVAQARLTLDYVEPPRWQRVRIAIGMLGLAFLGGLILNLMPCVLPVLSLKLFAILKNGGAAPARLRAGFLATASGILVSFVALALGLILLRKAGGLVGWGIQFQQPGFIAGMAVLTTVFALNLWGLFDVPLPGALGRVLGAPGREGLARDFATGLFATLLATPCSAPFVGTAIGFALARESRVILAIFVALGLGFALPYLVLAALPRLAGLLPKPGPWMIRLRQVLGLALAGTALWLLSILAAQVGPAVAGIVAALMAALAVLLALRGRMPAVAANIVAAGLALAALIVPITASGDGGTTADPGHGTVAWIPFDRGAAKILVAQGKTVFVDVGAQWCPTCRLNEQVVIEREPVASRLSGAVVPMKADWTRPDPVVARFLASYGRYAIPFTIVYGPGAPNGIPLPEILTSGTVLAALDRAGRNPASAQADGAR